MRLLFVIIIILIGIIPYLTGIEIERQFAKINQDIYQPAKLKLLKSDYQRGWFNSVTNSIMVKADEDIFKLRHEINHGFMPIIKSSIRTIIKNNNDRELSDISTKITINGDNTSILSIPVLKIGNYKSQDLQGHIIADRRFSKVEAVFNSPQLSNNSIEAKNIALQLNIVNKIANGNLKIANIFGQGTQLEAIKLFGNGRIQNSKLELDVQAKIRKVGNYASSSSNIKLSNWHLPALLRMILTKDKDITFNLMVQGVELLEHSPELAINDFKLNTQEGLVYGSLQLKIELPENPILILFNPNPLLHILTLQTEIHIPKSFIATIPYESVRKQLEIWVERGILIANENYYQSYISLNKGLLEVNGKPLPLTAILR